jgi:hypothetical protein
MRICFSVSDRRRMIRKIKKTRKHQTQSRFYREHELQSHILHGVVVGGAIGVMGDDGGEVVEGCRGRRV